MNSEISQIPTSCWEHMLMNVNSMPCNHSLTAFKLIYQNNISIYTNDYDDIIMGTMASQITSLTIVYPTVYSGADKKKPSKLRVTGLCAVNSPGTSEFPAQMASNAENVSIWWRHHGITTLPSCAFYTMNFQWKINDLWKRSDLWLCRKQM